jgi:hypothetical protein
VSARSNRTLRGRWCCAARDNPTGRNVAAFVASNLARTMTLARAMAGAAVSLSADALFD